MFDAHIHYYYGKNDTPAEFLRKAHASGITGGNIFSTFPSKMLGCADGDYRWQARLETILEYTAELPGFNPFFWINPMDADFEEQISSAVEQGIAGFKIICMSYYPEDCLPACRVIAETGKPLMFHSGVLGCGRDMLSAKYNLPHQFECLLSVPKLRFSMAHLGWPWVDDYMAMVAKSRFSYDPDFGNEMFFDLTPGTPGMYREEALRKLYLSGYRIKNLVLWGTDGDTSDYRRELPEYWLERDKAYMAKIAQDAELCRLPYVEAPDLSDILHLATEENWKRFLKR